MSEYSIEHSLTFNTAKRILKFISPDFRVIATDNLGGSDSSLDLVRRTLEVPEGDVFMAAGIIVFNAGILQLENDENFNFVFGKIPRNALDEDLVEEAVNQHVQADEIAFSWAYKMILAYFPEINEKEAKRISDHRMGRNYWKSYFSS